MSASLSVVSSVKASDEKKIIGCIEKALIAFCKIPDTHDESPIKPADLFRNLGNLVEVDVDDKKVKNTVAVWITCVVCCLNLNGRHHLFAKKLCRTNQGYSCKRLGSGCFSGYSHEEHRGTEGAVVALFNDVYKNPVDTLSLETKEDVHAFATRVFKAMPFAHNVPVPAAAPRTVVPRTAAPVSANQTFAQKVAPSAPAPDAKINSIDNQRAMVILTLDDKGQEILESLHACDKKQSLTNAYLDLSVSARKFANTQDIETLKFLLSLTGETIGKLMRMAEKERIETLKIWKSIDKENLDFLLTLSDVVQKQIASKPDNAARVKCIRLIKMTTMPK